MNWTDFFLNFIISDDMLVRCLKAARLEESRVRRPLVTYWRSQTFLFDSQAAECSDKKVRI